MTTTNHPAASEPAAEDRARLHDVLAGLATEQVADGLADFDLRSTEAQLATMVDESAVAVEAVRDATPQIAAAVDAIVARLRAGGRLVYLGAGTAGRLGVLDASEIPPTFGTDPSLVVGLIAGGETAIRHAVENAEDDAEQGAADVAAIGIGPLDALVGISASGRTPYVLGALAHARAAGALTVALASNRGSEIGAAADLAIETAVGPEVVAGSTRLKAGTAQKLVLNAISTLAMVHLGKVHGNLMVDVRATNAKLRARAERIVMAATGCESAEAAAALASTGGAVKPAILVTLTGVDAEVAVRALDREDGVLRGALERLASADRPEESHVP
ncbi:N-acetylmuramic acid 6-phosphate etherase [Agromyces protaetiae]|uniref:N-acetylmuramic acid 6-phosphate etherase n=1 Tax=Agromyces protaetiae TaxID=2509455 RepID=A0A4P6FA03_9MICO|nr:N-acetylmuramic acid 6-phosphate etherase [Agromyces protaetiae]QAY73020.1 N-acetylmuramic acid 6-phosphate etherase [Agromyces protaetiae]